MAKKESNISSSGGLVGFLKTIFSIIVAIGSFIVFFELGYSQGEKNLESKMYEEIDKTNKEYQIEILKLNSQIIDLKTKNSILELSQVKQQKIVKNEN